MSVRNNRRTAKKKKRKASGNGIAAAATSIPVAGDCVPGSIGNGNLLAGVCDSNTPVAGDCVPGTQNDPTSARFSEPLATLLIWVGILAGIPVGALCLTKDLDYTHFDDYIRENPGLIDELRQLSILGSVISRNTAAMLMRTRFCEMLMGATRPRELRDLSLAAARMPSWVFDNEAENRHQATVEQHAKDVEEYLREARECIAPSSPLGGIEDEDHAAGSGYDELADRNRNANGDGNGNHSDSDVESTSTTQDAIHNKRADTHTQPQAHNAREEYLGAPPSRRHNAEIFTGNGTAVPTGTP